MYKYNTFHLNVIVLIYFWFAMITLFILSFFKYRMETQIKIKYGLRRYKGILVQKNMS